MGSNTSVQDKTEFQANSCFWFYSMIAVVTLVIGWILFLWNYDEYGWPNNLDNWEYANHDVVMMIVWSIFLLLLTWGSYHADCRDIPGVKVDIYRLLFLATMVFNAVMIWLFYDLRMAKEALYCMIFIIMFILTLTVMYSMVHVMDAWFLFPYFLWICFTIYSFWYLIRNGYVEVGRKRVPSFEREIKIKKEERPSDAPYLTYSHR